MTRRSLLFITALGVVFIALPGCEASSGSDVCGDLKNGLSKCGIAAGEIECSRLDVSAQEDLVQRIDSMGCEAVAGGRGAYGGGNIGKDFSPVDPRVCALGRFPCPEPPTPEPTDAKPRFPIVFVSGIDGAPTFDFSPRIIAALAARGIDAEHVTLSSWATTDARGAELWDAISSIRRRRGAAKVNLIGYAVGGLDCRWVTSDAKRLEALASVTTIATPHRGTRVADAALAALKSGATADVISSLVGASATPSTLPDQGALATTLEGLTVDTLEGTARDVSDEIKAAGVYVQSFAGVSHVLGRSSAASNGKIAAQCIDSESGALSFFHHEDAASANDSLNEVLLATAPFAGAPADGMVSVESAKWGHFRGCLPADHYDVIGQIARVTADPVTGFDAPRFYAWVASDLATRGF
jgi:triacylglycerol lipase